MAAQRRAWPVDVWTTALHASSDLTLASSGIKLEKLMGDGYEPAADTCVSAFVRLMKVTAEAQGEGE